ncbi:hypothetical protein BVY04_01470 [bacterium M21]|nr:hypothetical protein BVY04_01470 [bacterium M21]
MIKIQNTAGRDLEQLAQEHFDSLSAWLLERIGGLQQLLSGVAITLHHNTIAALQKRVDGLGVEERSAASDLCGFLLEQDSTRELFNLRDLICSTPETFSELHNEFQGIFRIKDYPEVLKVVFSYSAFAGGHGQKVSGYSGFDLVEKLGLKTCPYCNRQYIEPVRSKGGKKLRPALDHFYSKDEYPLFALSFYNLIPSCTLCNSSLKHSKRFSVDTHLHPYVEEFGKEAVFRYQVVDSDKFTTYLKIQGEDASRRHRIRNSSEVFIIEDLYLQHDDVAREIRKKALENSPEHQQAMFKLLAEINKTEKEFYQFYFGNYMDGRDHERRPLAKFTRDLVDDLGITQMFDIG